MSRALELWSATFFHVPLPEIARGAGAAGFSHITATPGMFMRDGGFGGNLRARIEDAGVTVTVLDGLCSALPGAPQPRSRTGDFSDTHEARFEDCVAIAHALGAGTVNLVHIEAPLMPVDQLAEAFAALCGRATEEGLRLGIEFVPGSGIPTIETAAAVIRQAGAANGSLLLDTWHLARTGGGLADLDPATVALIGGLQLADRSPEQDDQPYIPMRGRKLPGDGALPLAEIAARVLAAHPDLPIGFEILSEEVDRLGPDAGARAIVRAARSIAVA